MVSKEDIDDELQAHPKAKSRCLPELITGILPPTPKRPPGYK